MRAGVEGEYGARLELFARKSLDGSEGQEREAGLLPSVVRFATSDVFRLVFMDDHLHIWVDVHEDWQGPHVIQVAVCHCTQCERSFPHRLRQLQLT